MKFKMLGIVFEIRFSFVLILAFAIIFELDSLLYVLLFAVLHETGHLAALYIQHKKADKIVVSFNGFGLVHTCRFTFLQEFCFLLAGIAVNLLFTVADICREINLSLLALNILPIYPLDGGRLLKLVLNRAFSLHISDAVFRMVSAVFIAAVLFICVYFKNLNLFLICIYSVVYSINNSID